jgi:hypothetical protein
MPHHTGLKQYQVYTVEEKHIVHVPGGRGTGLQAHLLSHGITSEIRGLDDTPYDRVEVPRDVSAETLQTLLDHCSR